MSKAITSCKKALAYLLTAAMVLGMAVTSPITAVEVKAAGTPGYVVLASGAGDKITLTSANQDVDETPTDVTSTTKIDPSKGDITVTVTPATGKWITKVSAAGTGLEEYSKNINSGWGETDGSVEFTIPASSMDAGTLDGNIEVDADVIDTVYITETNATNATITYTDGYLGVVETSKKVAEKDKKLSFTVKANEDYVLKSVAVKITDHTDDSTGGYGENTSGKTMTPVDGVYSIDYMDVVGDVEIVVTTVDAKAISIEHSEEGYVIEDTNGNDLSENAFVGNGLPLDFTVKDSQGKSVDPAKVDVGYCIGTLGGSGYPDDYTLITSTATSGASYTGNASDGYVYHIGAGEQINSELHIYVKNKVSGYIKLATANEGNNENVHLKNVVLGTDGKSITTNADDDVKAVNGGAVVFTVTPDDGYKIEAVNASIGSNENYSLGTSESGSGELAVNGSPEDGEPWTVTISDTQMDSLDGDVLLKVTVAPIAYSVTLELSADDHAAFGNSATITDYVLGLKSGAAGSEVANASDAVGPYPTYSGWTYGQDVFVVLKKDLDTSNKLETLSITAEETAVDDNNNHKPVSISNVGNDSEGNPVYKISEIGKNFGDVTVKIALKYGNTVKITGANTSSGTLFDIYTDPANNGGSSITYVKESDSPLTYRVKSGVKVGVNVTNVKSGSTVVVTDNTSKNTEKQSGVTSRGIGKWQAADAVSGDIEFTVTETTDKYTITNISDAEDGYKLKIRVNDGVFETFTGEKEVNYGDKVDFQVYNKSDSIIKLDGGTNIEATETTPDSKAKLDLTINGIDRASTILTKLGGSNTHMTIDSVEGNVEIGVRRKKAAVTQSVTYVAPCDKDLKVADKNGSIITANEKVKVGDTYSFKIVTGKDGVVTPVSADDLRVQYVIAGTDAVNVTGYTSNAINTLTAVNGVYTIPAASNNIFIRAERLHKITVNVDENIDVSGTSTQYNFGTSKSYDTTISDSTAATVIEKTVYDITTSNSATNNPYYLYIKATPKATYATKMTVDGEECTVTNNEAEISINKMNVTDPTNPTAINDEYDFPEVINIGVEDVKHNITIDKSGLKSSNAKVEIYEGSVKLTPQEVDNNDVYALKQSGVYTMKFSGYDTVYYDQTTPTITNNAIGDIGNVYVIDAGTTSGVKEWELSSITGDETLTFAESWKANYTLTVKTSAGVNAKVSATANYRDSDTDIQGRKNGFYENTTDVGKSDFTADSTGTGVKVFYGEADIKIKPSFDERKAYKFKDIIDGAGAVVPVTENPAGTYVIDKDTVIGGDAITIETEADESKLYNVELTVGKNVSVTTTATTNTVADTTHNTEGTETVLSDSNTITITVATPTGGYVLDEVVKEGTARFVDNSDGTYTLTFTEGNVGPEKSVAVNVKTKPAPVSRDVYVKINENQENVRYEIADGKKVSDDVYLMEKGGEDNELTLKVYVNKGYKLGTAVMDSIGSVAQVGTVKAEGDEWLYEYTINGSKIAATTAGQTQAGAYGITIGAPTALKVALKNLTGNTVNYTVDGGTIDNTINANNSGSVAAGSEISISVADGKIFKIDGEEKVPVDGKISLTAALKASAMDADTIYEITAADKTYPVEYIVKVVDNTGADATPEKGSAVEIPANTTLTGYTIRVYKKGTDGQYVNFASYTGDNSEKIYASTDGGETWVDTLFTNGNDSASPAVNCANSSNISIGSMTSTHSYMFKDVLIDGGVKTETILEDTITFKKKGVPGTISSDDVEEGVPFKVAPGATGTITLNVKDTNDEAIENPVITFKNGIKEDETGKIKLTEENGVITVAVDSKAVVGTKGEFTVKVTGGENPEFTFTVEVKKPITIIDATISGSVSSLKMGGSKELKVTKIMGKKDGSDTATDVTSEIADSDIKVETANGRVKTSVTDKVITITPVKEGEDTITITIGEWSKTYPVTVKPESSVPEEAEGEVKIYVNGYYKTSIKGVIGKTISREDVEAEALAALGNVEYLEGWYKNSTLRTRWDFATDVVEENTVIYGRALYEVKDDAAEKTARIQEVWPQTYTGSVIKPSVVVTDENGNLLKLNKDYKVSYNERKGEAKLGKDADVVDGEPISGGTDGGYYFTVEFIKDYSALSKQKVHYNIEAIHLDNATVTLSDKTGQFVTGKNIKPVSSVKYGKKTLKLGTDYEYEVYKDGDDSDPFVTCSGTSYKGQKFDAGYYYIKLKAKTTNFVDQEYSDTYYYPQMVVQDAAKLVKNMTITNIKALALTEDKDSGEIIPSVPTFEIKAKDMPKAVIFEGKEGVAEDKSGTPVGSWSDDGYYWTFSNTKKEDQFRVYIFNNESVGKKAEIYVEGCGYEGYFGEKTVNFTIKASGKLVKNDLIDKDMQKNLAAVENVYCGEGITIEDIIENMNAGGAEYDLDSIVNKKYILGQHYIITYKKNVNKGTATMTFKGQGIYAGSSFTQNFKIVPIMISKPSDEDYRVGISSDLGAEVSGNAVVLPAECYKADGKNLTDETLAKLLYDDEAERYLVNKVDYTVTVKTVRSSGSTYTYLIIKGKNNYSAKDGRTVPEIDIYKQVPAI